MKHKLSILMAAATLFAAGCQNKQSDMNDTVNPFFSEWNTPYNIPDFSRIKTEHYMPAFEEGIRQQKAEIDAIVNNPEAPTFENTILAYEYSGQLLREVGSIFFNLSECENNEEMEAIEEKVTPMLASRLSMTSAITLTSIPSRPVSSRRPTKVSSAAVPMSLPTSRPASASSTSR